MQQPSPSASPPWRSDRRSSPSAGGAAGRGRRRRSAWRSSARSAGGRCGCRVTGRSRRSSSSSLVAASLGYLQGKGVWREGFAAGWPVVVLAGLAASLPFIVEGHFGILGTSFNPDMSQHLLAADQLAHGHSGQLIHQGYPLGPHSIVVALNKGLDIGLVKGFSGLERGGRDARPADRARRLPRPPPAAPHRRGAGRRPRLRGGELLRPGRLQGDDARLLPPRLRPLPARGAREPTDSRSASSLRP